MTLLVGCEFSGIVRDAFRSKGVDAWSCDLLPCEGDPTYHIQGDVLENALSRHWDAFICHPPCTYLCNSGVRWLFGDGKQASINSDRYVKMVEGANFFLSCWNLPIQFIGIENPVQHKHAFNIIQRKPDQIIQPYHFGHGESKATGLWLKGLPKLKPTHLFNGNKGRVHSLPPSADRWKERSKTLPGIANAMATQWTEWINHWLKK